jgi:demethylmenaquinone methyltransferase/2-methoxy-6-polyprenyl-1,4-benzoquinol methylase
MDGRAVKTAAPHYTGEKSEYVRDMFASIAHRYDLLNSILSFNRHYAWRRKAVRLAKLQPGDSALDVCTGTGDFAIDLYRAVGPTGRVVGSDFCAPMLQRGREKTDAVSGGRIEMMVADAQALPYRDNLFDCVTVGFGIRNVSDTQKAFAEMARVAKPGGRVVCLEFNTPRNPILRPLVRFYEMKVLPRIGALLSKSEAYTYLPKSIQAFHTREELAEMMRGVGLDDVRVYDLNLGSVCIHIGTKTATGS